MIKLLKEELFSQTVFKADAAHIKEEAEKTVPNDGLDSNSGAAEIYNTATTLLAKAKEYGDLLVNVEEYIKKAAERLEKADKQMGSN